MGGAWLTNHAINVDEKTEAHCCQCSSGQVTWSTDGCKVCQDEAKSTVGWATVVM